MSLATDLLAAARGLIEQREAATTGLWPRAAAVLARQALELSIRALWLQRAPGLESCSLRAQLLCLDEYLRDENVAATTRQAWAALSRACHHHPYEIDPTVEELRYWIDAVERLADAVEARLA